MSRSTRRSAPLATSSASAATISSTPTKARAPRGASSSSRTSRPSSPKRRLRSPRPAPTCTWSAPISREYDFEAELAVVIGAQCKDVSQERSAQRRLRIYRAQRPNRSRPAARSTVNGSKARASIRVARSVRGSLRPKKSAIRTRSRSRFRSERRPRSSTATPAKMIFPVSAPHRRAQLRE